MIHLIAAINKSRGIGKQGELLYRLPNDMKHFKNLTEGNFVVMGKNTYSEIGKPLSNRTNIVLSRDTKYDPHPAVYVYNSVSEVLRQYKEYAEEQVDLYICGGESLYKQFMSYSNYIHLTIIDDNKEADTFFPEFDISEWEVISNIHNESDDQNEYSHSFITYKRRLK